METLVLHSRWALGDAVALSALVRDLALAHPGRYRVLLRGHYQSLWENNPHCAVMPREGVAGARHVELEYRSGIKAAGRGEKVHFLSWFHRDFARRTGVAVPLTLPRGDLHLSAAEKAGRLFPRRYWVVNAGGKADMPAKVWPLGRFQAAVDALAALGVPCVQAGADFNGHRHPRLKNCLSAIGRTDSIRDLFSLVYHADGVLCGITGLAHIAAALEKPAVVIAGGREEPLWEWYGTGGQWPAGAAPVRVPHRFLHTVGLLDCGCGNLTKGCWKDLVVPPPHKPSQQYQRKLCRRPLTLAGEAPVPECLALIGVDAVVAAVLSYYGEGILPEIRSVTMPEGRRWVWRLEEVDGRTAETAETALPPVRPVAAPPAPAGPPVLPAVATPPPADPGTILDHPHVAGKFTICVLGYGEHLHLVRRCLTSVLSTCPPARIELRVALNQPSPAVEEYVRGLHPALLSVDRGSRRKYPAMRALFHAAGQPLTTKYVIWFDDDSHAVEPDWLTQLAKSIAENHHGGCRLYGTKFYHDLMLYRRQGFRPEKWFQAAPWWRGRPLLLRPNGPEVPNGTVVPFVSGGFWALAAETIMAGDIPDPRVGHNGDPHIGEAVRQLGFKIKDFARGKKPVCWSDAPRRGFAGPFPWADVR